MIKRLKKLNRALPELLAGILGYGLVVLGVGIFFAGDKLNFAIGLGIGIVCAVFMAYHMAATIEDSVSLKDEKLARNKSVAGATVRYGVVFAVFLAMMYFHIGSLVGAFLGIMGLKVSAYIMQSVFHTVKNDPKRMVPPEEQDEIPVKKGV